MTSTWLLALILATMSASPLEWPCATSTTITSTPASISALARTSASPPTPTAGADHQPAVGVLGGQRVLLALGEVLDRDEPAQPAVGVDQRQLLDLVLPQQANASSRETPTGAVTSGIGVMTSRTGRSWSVSKRMSRLVTMPTSTPAASVTGTPEIRYVAQSRSTSASVSSGAAGHRVGDHARLGPLDQVDLLGLLLDRQVAVQDADAALPGHGDRHPGLGHGVHRRGDQRDAQGDAA